MAKYPYFSNIKVLKGRHVWKYYFVDNGVSSILLFFIPAMVLSKFGMKPKTNSITFEQKLMFCSEKNSFIIKMCQVIIVNMMLG